MNPAEIKAVINQKGFSITLLAETLGKTAPAVGAVINRRTTSHEIAGAIAKVVGKPLLEVFPDVATYRNPAASKNRQVRAQREEELRQLLAS